MRDTTGWLRPLISEEVGPGGMAGLPEYLQDYVVLLLCLALVVQILTNLFLLPRRKRTESFDVRSGRRHPSLGEHVGEGDVIAMTADYARRGQLWSKHPSWTLDAPRMPNSNALGEGVGHVLAILKKYDVDPTRGFLPSRDPLQRLSYARYHIWEDLCDDLPKLLGARLGQVQHPPEIQPFDILCTRREDL